MGASIRDIARQAGVSIGTVSRVINGEDSVGLKVQEKTIKAMRELNYIPHKKSRKIKKDISKEKNWNIGVIFYGVSEALAGNDLVSYSISNITTACRQHGYNIIYEIMSSGSMELPKCVEDRKVDGVIIAINDKDIEIAYKISVIMPAVILNKYWPTLQIPQVCIDEYGSCSFAISEIIKYGHRKIAFVSPCILNKNPSFLARCRAYKDMMIAEGIYDPAYTIYADIVNDENPYNDSPPEMGCIADKLLGLEHLPTAILVANDWSAVGLYKALEERGISPGKDISIVGFDDFLPKNIFLDPPLATLAVPFKEIAETAAETLIDYIEGGKMPVCAKMLPCKFIHNASLQKI